MLKELQTKADDAASSLNALPHKLQPKAPQIQDPAHKDLSEVKSALTNLQASLTSLTSELHKTADQQNKRLTEMGNTINNINQPIKTSSSDSQPSTVLNTEQLESKITKLDNEVLDLSHSVNALSTDLHQSVNDQESMLNKLNTKTDHINASLNGLPSKVQETVDQHDLKLQKLETEVSNMSSILNTVSSDLQKTDKKLTSLNNMTSQILSNISQMIKDHPNLKCPDNWILHSSNCYLFSRDRLAWHAAKDSCVSRGATLLIVTKEEEWQFVTQYTMPTKHWVGLTDEHTGVWRWVDETPYEIDSSKWDADQPDNWTQHGLGGAEDCAQLIWNGKLNDDHCSRSFNYVCKKAASSA
ncbi:hypothetical protein ACEWY4_009636 [Coilia grayii]|uniref:C-type lectin domain-containing protein n=1 Tax=Coilia grayii TaxID=363190 RepID=A0ABD1K709_9TELE